VVHNRQINKSIVGIVLTSDPSWSRVMFSGEIQRRLGGALLPTADLEFAK
jgi:hypothetical protein